MYKKKVLWLWKALLYSIALSTEKEKQEIEKRISDGSSTGAACDCVGIRWYYFFLSWSWDPDSAQRTVCMCNALGRTTGGGLELWGTGTRALSCSSTLSVSDKVTWSWRSGGYDRAFVSFCLVTRRPLLFVLFKYSFLPVWPANSHQGTPVTVDWQWTANPGMHYWLVTDEYE